MCDLAHLCDGIRDRDQFLRRPPPRQQHGRWYWSMSQALKYRIERQPPVEQGVGDLIEDHEKMHTRPNRFFRANPAIPRKLGRTLEVVALPAEAIAETFDF